MGKGIRWGGREEQRKGPVKSEKPRARKVASRPNAPQPLRLLRAQSEVRRVGPEITCKFNITRKRKKVKRNGLRQRELV